MEREWNPVIVWFCLGLFVLAEVGNIEMGGEIRRVCALAGDSLAPHLQTAVDEIGTICANCVPDDNYRVRLEARQARRD